MKPKSPPPTTIEGQCTAHPWAKLNCPVCCGRKGGRGHKGKRARRSELSRVFKELKQATWLDFTGRSD